MQYMQTFTHLQTQEGEYCQRERGEDDDIAEILDGIDDGRDDGLEAWDHSNGLKCAEDAEGAESSKASQVDGDGDVGHEDHQKVQPVPRVTQVGEAVDEEAPRQQLDCRLVGVDGSKYHFGGGGVPKGGEGIVSPLQGTGRFEYGHIMVGRADELPNEGRILSVVSEPTSTARYTICNNTEIYQTNKDFF